MGSSKSTETHRSPGCLWVQSCLCLALPVTIFLTHSHLSSAPVLLVGSRNNCSFWNYRSSPCLHLWLLSVPVLWPLCSAGISLSCVNSCACKERALLPWQVPWQGSAWSPCLNAGGCLSPTETPSFQRKLGTRKLSLHALPRRCCARTTSKTMNFGRFYN